MTMNYDNLMLKNLPKRIYNLLESIGEMGDQLGYNTFVVGGFVRDLILGRENLDIDIIAEGDGVDLADEFAKARDGKAKTHERFGTAVVTLLNGLKIDFATARTEIYERPGALPTVQFGSIEDDLKRRDFTINAMAIRLNENDFGEIVDCLGGKSDLEKGIIKIIHDQSFQDDPTRIFRAIRYEQRYGFCMDKQTEDLLKTAVENDFLNTITKQRLRNEIMLILGEENSVKPIDRLDQLKILRYVHPKISLTKNNIIMLSKIDGLSQFSSIPLLTDNKKFDIILLKLMAIMDGLNENEANEASKNLSLSKKYTEAISASVAKLPSALKVISAESIRPSEIYRVLKDLPIQTLFFGIFKASDKDTAYKIFMYFLIEVLEPFITGGDLMELGYPEGSLYSEILSDVFDAQIDEIVNDKQEAIEYIQKKYKQKG
ncbi:MAG: CCA tRNA nucleotidyltransferase [Candidatus Poribacteria bacterium]